MSKSALQLLARQNGGLVPLLLNTDPQLPAGATRLQGLWVLDDQILAIDAGSVVGDTFNANGLTFDSVGRLVISTTAAGNHHQGLPYIDGAVVVSGSGDEYFSQGLKFSGGGLGATGLAPPCAWIGSEPWVGAEPWC